MKGKKELIEALRRNGAFYSYESSSDFTDELIIEQCLRYGDVEQLKNLFKLYPINKIKNVWRTYVIPDTRLYAHNYYLATIFFDIKSAKAYIKRYMKKNARNERIRLLNA